MLDLEHYEIWESSLHPCDLILISSPGLLGKFISFFEKFHTNTEGKWIHAGVVSPNGLLNLKNNEDSKIYILESLISGLDTIYDTHSASLYNGVQVRELKSVVKNVIETGGCVASVPLKNNIFPKTVYEEKNLTKKELKIYYKSIDDKIITGIKTFWKKFSKSKYDFWNVSRSVGLHMFFCFKKNTKKHLFCSELVIRLYQEMGIVEKNIDSEKISPEELGEWCGDVNGDCPYDLEKISIIA